MRWRSRNTDRCAPQSSFVRHSHVSQHQQAKCTLPARHHTRAVITHSTQSAAAPPALHRAKHLRLA